MQHYLDRFKLLYKNKISLTPSLWIYAIHGRNPEIIHILEENNIKPEDKTFVKCYEEAIKYHHNELADYINNNYLEKSNIEISKILKCYNFEFLIDDYCNELIFEDLCQYGYYSLAEFIMNISHLDVNKNIIYIDFSLYNLNNIFLMQNQKKF